METPKMKLSSMTTLSLVGQLTNWPYFYTSCLMRLMKQLATDIGFIINTLHVYLRPI